MKVRLLAVAMVAVIGIFSALSLYFGYYVVHYDEIPMDLVVADRVGVNGDTDALHFGTTFAGSNTTRHLIVTNSHEFPITVEIANKGNISDWVYCKTGIEVLPNKNHSIEYVVSLPADAQRGSYEGLTRITVKRDLW